MTPEDTERLDALAVRLEVLEERLDGRAITMWDDSVRVPRKPFASSLTPGVCDCDRYGVLHVREIECFDG